MPGGSAGSFSRRQEKFETRSRSDIAELRFCSAHPLPTNSATSSPDTTNTDDPLSGESELVQRLPDLPLPRRDVSAVHPDCRHRGRRVRKSTRGRSPINPPVNELCARHDDALGAPVGVGEERVEAGADRVGEDERADHEGLWRAAPRGAVATNRSRWARSPRRVTRSTRARVAAAAPRRRPRRRTRRLVSPSEVEPAALPARRIPARSTTRLAELLAMKRAGWSAGRRRPRRPGCPGWPPRPSRR